MAKKKIDLIKYEHLFDEWMPLGLKLKRLEKLIDIVEELLIEIPKLRSDLKKKENSTIKKPSKLIESIEPKLIAIVKEMYKEDLEHGKKK